jgi:hypothetical protein
MRFQFAFLAFLIEPAIAFAHHSTVGFYDPNQVVEVEGLVSSVSWRNPHTLITIDVVEADGSTQEWRIETGAISVLRSRGLAREFLGIGDRIKVSGDPSSRGRPDIFAHNILLENGTEVLLTVYSEPRWTSADGNDLLAAEFSDDVEAAARQRADGIFRVWSTVLGDPDSWPMFVGDYPLTAEAREALERWNPQDLTQLGCPAKGMPLMMNTPLPIEFVRDGDNVLLRLEELDGERQILMNAGAAEPGEYSLSGHSMGRWDAGTLVVETVNVDAGRFNANGIPQSRSARFVERFTLSENQERLDYDLQVTDPETFTTIIELSRYFVWRPEIEVLPYECDARTEFYDE